MICNPAKFQAIMLENCESDIASRNKKNRKPEYPSRLSCSCKSVRGPYRSQSKF